MKKLVLILFVLVMGFAVASCGNKEDAAAATLASAKTSLNAVFSDPSNITNNISVPTSLSNGEVTAVWTSSEPGVISFQDPVDGVAIGVVNRPDKGDGDVKVTVTATLSIQSSLSDEMLEDTWSIELTVKENTVVEISIDTVSDILAITDSSYDGEYQVTIENMTVIAKGDDGAFAYDGTGIIQIYAGASDDMEVGKVYTVSGTIDWYYGLWEITGSTATEQTSATPQYPTKETINDVGSYIEDLVTAGKDQPSRGTVADGSFEPIYATVTGKVYMIPDDTSNYNTYIISTDEDTFVPGTSTQVSNGLMVYYHTNDFDKVRLYDGITVTMDVVLYTYRSNNNAFAIYYVGGPDGITATLTDTQKQSIDAGALSIPESTSEAITLDLPTTGDNGSTIVWTFTDSDNAANSYVNLTTGAVTVPSGEQVTVGITATVSFTGLTDIVRNFTIKIGEYPVSTIAEAQAAGADAVVKVVGIVTDTSDAAKYGAYWLQDATGGLQLFSYSDIFTEDMVGKTYEIVGTIDEYHGKFELVLETTDTMTELTGDDALTMPDAVDISALTFDDATLMPYMSMLVDLNRVVLVDDIPDATTIDSDSFTFDVVTLTGQTISVTVDKDNPEYAGFVTTLAGATAGTPFDFENLIVGWYDGAELIVGANTTVTEGSPLTDAEKLAADKAMLDFGGNVFAATTVDLPATGANGSTIAWSITADAGSNASYDAGTGVLTIVDPTAEATVEITANLTLGTATDSAVFTYNLMLATAIDLGDFASQTSGEVVAVQGVVYAVIQNGFFIEDSTGQVFVSDYDATYVAGDEVQLIGTVGAYNGSPELKDLLGLPTPISTGNDISMEPIMYQDGVTTLVPGQLYTVIGTVAIEGQYDDVYIYYNTTDSFEVYYKSPDTALAALEALEGEMVAVNLIYYNDDTSFVYVGDVGDFDGVGLYGGDITDFSDLYAMTDSTNYDITNDTWVTLTGVVTGDSYDGLFLQDENGVGFFMYKPDETGISIGDKVVYFGQITDYNGARQLAKGAMQVEIISHDNTLVVTAVTADEINAFGMNDAGTLFSFDGFKLASVSGTTMTLEYTMSDTTTGTVTIRYYSSWDDLNVIADNYSVGDALPNIQFILYNFRDDLIQLDVVSADFTDADYLSFDVANVPDPLQLVDDFVIPTGDFGSTYTVTAVSSEIAPYVDFETTPGTLIYTQPAADVTGTATVTVTNGSESTTITMNIVVKAPLPAGTYTETFALFPETSSSYNDGSYTGDNSILWTYTESRGDQNIDDDALCFAKSSTASLTATITGGISSFSIEYKNAFTTAAGVKVYINGELVGTSAEVSDKVAVTYNLDLSSSNITGTFTITIMTTNGQLVIDNLTWTTNPAPSA